MENVKFFLRNFILCITDIDYSLKKPGKINKVQNIFQLLSFFTIYRLLAIMKTQKAHRNRLFSIAFLLLWKTMGKGEYYV